MLICSNNTGDTTVPVSERTILVTGASGQVGFELLRSLQGLGRVVAMDRHALDISKPDEVRDVVRMLRPALIINPAAYTAVDQAENDQTNAFLVNAQAPGVLAEEARRLDALLVHYSTDQVFDGAKDGPYLESDTPNPQNVYGASKLAGERAIAEVGCAHLIFRTSWVYGRRGKNFLLTMLRLASEGRDLRVVGDQFGAPTWSRTVAALTAHIIGAGLLAAGGDAQWWQARAGLYNLSATGSTSWAGFAEAIFDLAALKISPSVTSISTLEYQAPAKRPSNSRLSADKLTLTFGVQAPAWRDALQQCLAD